MQIKSASSLKNRSCFYMSKSASGASAASWKLPICLGCPDSIEHREMPQYALLQALHFARSMACDRPRIRYSA